MWPKRLKPLPEEAQILLVLLWSPLIKHAPLWLNGMVFFFLFANLWALTSPKTSAAGRVSPDKSNYYEQETVND